MIGSYLASRPVASFCAIVTDLAVPVGPTTTTCMFASTSVPRREA